MRTARNAFVFFVDKLSSIDTKFGVFEMESLAGEKRNRAAGTRMFSDLTWV